MPPPIVAEPAPPLWALAPAVLTAGAWLAALPGSPAVAVAGAAASAGDAAASLGIVLAADAAFGAAVAAFFALASWYGTQRHPGGGVKPYAGPWRDAKGVPHPPAWFAPGYLLFALNAAAIAPLGGLAWELVQTGGALKKAAAPTAIALAPYLALWAWQWCLEMKLLRHSILAPTIPLVFAVYRPWQLARGAGLVAACASATRVAVLLPPRWLAAALRALCLFWTFDTAALLVWLPWTYGWQTQRG